MLHLCVTDDERDAESESVVVQSGYFIIGCLRRDDQEIIISAHYVERFIDIWVQEFIGGIPQTLSLQRFSMAKDRLDYIQTMTQGFVDAGWTFADIRPPRARVARRTKH
jgi:hypothetical protein